MSVEQKINEYMDAYTKLWPFSGSIAVVREGEVIFNKSYGYSSIEYSVFNSSKTVFKIASLTKQITCMGIMMLKERGLLNVTDSIRKFFPDYPEFDERDAASAFSAGAIYSTVHDMLLWDKALYTEKLVSKKTMNEIFTPVLEGYGYGWFIDKYLNRRRVRHSGGGNGFNHQFHRYIDDKVSILVLSNYGFSNSFRINEDIAKIVFNEKYSLPVKPEAFDLDLSVYDSYCGIYKEEYLKYEVKRDGDKLYFIQEDKWVMPIYPISKTTFHHTWIDREYAFEKNDKGEVYFDEIKKIN